MVVLLALLSGMAMNPPMTAGEDPLPALPGIADTVDIILKGLATRSEEDAGAPSTAQS